MNGLIRVVHILACTAIIAQVKSGTKEKLIACLGIVAVSVMSYINALVA